MYETSCCRTPEHNGLDTHHCDSFKFQTQSTKLTSPESLKFLMAKEFIIQTNPKDMHIERWRICCIPMTIAPDKCTGNQEPTITLFPQMVHLTNPMTDMCWDSIVGTATGYGLDSPGIESQWGVSCSAPVETGSGFCLASCTMGTGSLSQG